MIGVPETLEPSLSALGIEPYGPLMARQDVVARGNGTPGPIPAPSSPKLGRFVAYSLLAREADSCQGVLTMSKVVRVLTLAHRGELKVRIGGATVTIPPTDLHRGRDGNVRLRWAAYVATSLAKVTGRDCALRGNTFHLSQPEPEAPKA